jgi:hypothetical protein
MEHTIRAEKEKRPYHSPRRQRQAVETRQRILDSARQLLASNGGSSLCLGLDGWVQITNFILHVFLPQ